MGKAFKDRIQFVRHVEVAVDNDFQWAKTYGAMPRITGAARDLLKRGPLKTNYANPDFCFPKDCSYQAVLDILKYRSQGAVNRSSSDEQPSDQEITDYLHFQVWDDPRARASLFSQLPLRECEASFVLVEDKDSTQAIQDSLALYVRTCHDRHSKKAIHFFKEIELHYTQNPTARPHYMVQLLVEFDQYRKLNYLPDVALQPLVYHLVLFADVYRLTDKDVRRYLEKSPAASQQLIDKYGKPRSWWARFIAWLFRENPPPAKKYLDMAAQAVEQYKIRRANYEVFPAPKYLDSRPFTAKPTTKAKRASNFSVAPLFDRVKPNKKLFVASSKEMQNGVVDPKDNSQLSFSEKVVDALREQANALNRESSPPNKTTVGLLPELPADQTSPEVPTLSLRQQVKRKVSAVLDSLADKIEDHSGALLTEAKEVECLLTPDKKPSAVSPRREEFGSKGMSFTDMLNASGEVQPSLASVAEKTTMWATQRIQDDLFLKSDGVPFSPIGKLAPEEDLSFWADSQEEETFVQPQVASSPSHPSANTEQLPVAQQPVNFDGSVNGEFVI